MKTELKDRSSSNKQEQNGTATINYLKKIFFTPIPEEQLPSTNTSTQHSGMQHSFPFIRPRLCFLNLTHTTSENGCPHRAWQTAKPSSQMEPPQDVCLALWKKVHWLGWSRLPSTSKQRNKQLQPYSLPWKQVTKRVTNTLCCNRNKSVSCLPTKHIQAWQYI